MLSAFVLSLLVIVQLTPRDQEPVVAVFDPRLKTQELWQRIEMADTYLIGETAMPGSIILYSDRAGLAQRLSNSGALFVFSYYGAAGCRFDGKTRISAFSTTA